MAVGGLLLEEAARLGEGAGSQWKRMGELVVFGPAAQPVILL